MLGSLHVGAQRRRMPLKGLHNLPCGPLQKFCLGSDAASCPGLQGSVEGRKLGADGPRCQNSLLHAKDLVSRSGKPWPNAPGLAGNARARCVPGYCANTCASKACTCCLRLYGYNKAEQKAHDDTDRQARTSIIIIQGIPIGSRIGFPHCFLPFPAPRRGFAPYLSGLFFFVTGCFYRLTKKL